MELGQFRKTLHGITASELNQVLKLLGYWPVPHESFQLPRECLVAAWFCDYLACLGILDQPLRLVALERMRSRLTLLDEKDDGCIRIADRRFLYDNEGCLDLLTGSTYKTPPTQHVEKTTFDLRALLTRRRVEENA